MGSRNGQQQFKNDSPNQMNQQQGQLPKYPVLNQQMYPQQTQQRPFQIPPQPKGQYTTETPSHNYGQLNAQNMGQLNTINSSSQQYKATTTEYFNGTIQQTDPSIVGLFSTPMGQRNGQLPENISTPGMLMNMNQNPERTDDGSGYQNSKDEYYVYRDIVEQQNQAMQNNYFGYQQSQFTEENGRKQETNTGIMYLKNSYTFRKSRIINPKEERSVLNQTVKIVKGNQGEQQQSYKGGTHNIYEERIDERPKTPQSSELFNSRMVSSAVNPKQQQLIYNNNGNTNQTGVSQEQGMYNRGYGNDQQKRTDKQDQNDANVIRSFIPTSQPTNQMPIVNYYMNSNKTNGQIKPNSDGSDRGFWNNEQVQIDNTNQNLKQSLYKVHDYSLGGVNQNQNPNKTNERVVMTNKTSSPEKGIKQQIENSQEDMDSPEDSGSSPLGNNLIPQSIVFQPSLHTRNEQADEERVNPSQQLKGLRQAEMSGSKPTMKKQGEKNISWFIDQSSSPQEGDIQEGSNQLIFEEEENVEFGYDTQNAMMRKINTQLIQSWESSNGSNDQNGRGDQRKASLFRYDPSMYQSVAGYFYPSQVTQQAAAKEREAVLNKLREVYSNDLKKLQQLEPIVVEFFVNQERVYIQFINRELSGLQTADNLGDYFIGRYENSIEKRVAGCCNSQKFPVHIGVRGDGNCFYRALMVGYLTNLLTDKKKLEEYEQLIVDIAKGGHVLIELEYKDELREDSRNARIILVQQLIMLLLDRKKNVTDDESENAMFLMRFFDSIASNHDFDYALVLLSRSMISLALDKYATHPAYAEYFLPDDIARTAKKLRTYKEDAEYHAINLSTEVFRYPVQILQLQKDKYGHFELNESLVYSALINTPTDQGRILILLSEGHYDLVFDRSMCLRYFPQLSLFSKHTMYRDDLNHLIQDPNTPPARVSYYSSLLSDYQFLLRDQESLVVKMKESMVHLHSLYQSRCQGAAPSRIAHQPSESSTLLESSLKKDPPLEHQPEPGTGHYSKEIANDTNEFNVFERKESFIIPSEISPVIFEKQISQPLPSLQSSSHHNNMSLNLNSSSMSTFDFTSNYFNVESNKIRKLQQHHSTPYKNKLDSQTKKNVQDIKSICCDHASESQITIGYITCCKVNYELCYACFKTRQIIPCLICKKDILSHSRIQQTAKNYKYICKQCNPKSPTIVTLFNKLYCSSCDLSSNNNN